MRAPGTGLLDMFNGLAINLAVGETQAVQVLQPILERATAGGPVADKQADALTLLKR